MTKERWIAVAIIALVVLGSLALIKIFPFWVTLACLFSITAGFIAGYMYKKPEIITKIQEVIKEVPVPVKSAKTSKTIKN